jgi:hypothetical protein
VGESDGGDDDFRPRIGRRPRVDRDRSRLFVAQMRRAIQKYGGGRRTSSPARAKKGQIAVRPPHAQSRRCVIKARYVRLNANGLKAARLHLAYLERDGVERDGSPGRLYGADDGFTAEAFRAPLDGEKRQFRFIVSPEDGHRLDLGEFARQLMAQVENDTGRGLVWAAVNHHNTDNPHVHIVVRGVDRQGNDLRIDGPYIARGMRWRAQEIVTRELGPRSELDLLREQTVDVGRERLTEIDRVIDAHASPGGTVTIGSLLAAGEPEGRVCIARLHTLETMELATQTETGVWGLADGWKESLAALEERQQVVERLVPFVQQRAIAYRMVDPAKPIASFEGTLVGKGLDDELTGQMFAAVVTPAGDPFYVRLAPEMAAGLREGDVVRVGFDAEPWSKPADKIIARFAQENGGVYDPVRHQRALETLHRPHPGTSVVTPAERVAANVRRLERLARYRLATRLPDGRWKIPADLPTQLEDRERTHPQQRMRVERIGTDRNQTRFQGPTRERSELTAVAETAAKELRLAYVSDPPTFKGHVMEVRAAPSGREYALVVDYRRGQFTLIPKPPDWERFHGRTVHLARGRDQKLVIQLDRGLSR